MMKKLLFGLLIALSSCGSQSAVEQDNTLISLDNYAIPMNKVGAEVAHVVGREGKVTIKKDTSNLFIINSSGAISLKPEVSLTNTSPMRYEIVLDCAGKIQAFEFVKDEFIRNKVIAHRGAWKNYEVSQNSIGSLTKAMELGCEGIEFDVWYSSDNQIILSHDPSIGGKMVEDTPGDTLVTVALKNNEFVPTLKQYLDVIKSQNKSRLVLEIKVSEKGEERRKELAEAVVRMVHEEKAQAWVDYISFSFTVLEKIRELDKTAVLTYLESNKTLEEIKEAGLSGIDYHYSNFENDSTLITRSHELKLTTNAWTVNKEEDMTKFLSVGMDFITTDEPEILLNIVKK